MSKIPEIIELSSDSETLEVIEIESSDEEEVQVTGFHRKAPSQVVLDADGIVYTGYSLRVSNRDAGKPDVVYEGIKLTGGLAIKEVQLSYNYT